jgi:hypothetical protein
MFMPARLRCPECAGVSQTSLGPSSFLGQALYLVVCMSFGLAVAWIASAAPALFWPSIVLSLIALICYWSVIVPTLKLKPISPASLSWARAQLALRSGTFLRTLAWLFGLALVAGLYLFAIRTVAFIALS